MTRSKVNYFRAGLLVFCLAIAGHLSGLFDPFHRLTSDHRFAALSRSPTHTIVVLDIDSKSIDAVGQWPWPRGVHARIVDRLVAAKVKEIAFDVDFSSPSTPQEDDKLEAALARAGGIVLLAAFNQLANSDSQSQTLTSNRPLERFARHSWIASVNIFADPDSLVREFPLGIYIDNEFVYAMPAMLAGINRPSTSVVQIDFSINANEIDRISVIDLLEGKVDANRLRDKSVIVGSQAAELRDIFAVPRYGYLSGPMLQALSTETILQSRVLVPVKLPVLLVALALLIIVAEIITRSLPWRLAIPVLIGLIVVSEASATLWQVAWSASINIVMWQFAFLAYCAIALVRQIGFDRIMLFISRNQAENTQRILDQVISDNFDGVIVTDGEGIIKAVSRSAGKVLPAGTRGLVIGSDVADSVPEEFVTSIRQAVHGFREGTWRASQPQLTRHYFDDRRQRIFEHVVTPSRLKGGVSSRGAPTQGPIVVCLTFRDITDRWRAERRLKFLARFDPLTALPNKSRFADIAANTLNAARVHDQTFAFISIHLSRVDVINDTLGHEYGDQIIKSAADRLRGIVSGPDIIGYLGGHQFIVLAAREKTSDATRSLIERIIDDLSVPYEFDLHHAVVGVSAGVALMDGASARDDTVEPPGARVDRKIRHADMALIRARAIRGNAYRFFDPEMESKLHLHQAIELDLVKALREDEFEVFYQPQIDLRSGMVTGAEALVRWRHPQKSYISPDKFLPVAEVTGHIVDIGAFVLRRACQEVQDWPEPIKIAVNVSPAQFTDENFLHVVRQALDDSRLPASRLDLEITESLFIENNDIVVALMNRLRKRGIRFALDDFGTGYSSLSYIENFPIDKIKIDQSFVFGIAENPKSLAIVRAISTLSQQLGLDTIVEGVETREQLDLLRTAGCSIGQGYLFSKPLPNADMIAYLRRACSRVRSPAQARSA